MNDVYIKQVDCPEVQGLREKIERLDRFVVKGTEKILIAGPAYPENRDNYLWLPRQEDIQEMLFKAPEYFTDPMYARINFYPMVSDLVDYLRETLSGILAEEPTPDDCWLMFYMKMVHNKRWTEEGWV